MTLRRRLALLTLLVMAAAACSGSGTSETFQDISEGLNADAAVATTVASATTTTSAPPTTTVGSPQAQGGTDERSSLGSGAITPVLAQPSDLGRDIIFTGDVVIAAPDVAKASEEATRIIQAVGGFLFGQRTVGGPNPETVLVFKVFPDDFQTALDRLGSIGEIRSQTVSADDVTEAVVDLQSRINTAQASVERLRGFLATAEGIETIAEIENQLLQRETQLETLRGQLRTLEDLVSLATITLTITEATTRPEIRFEVTAYPGHDGAGLSCPGNTSLSVEEGSEVTLCFEVTNVGDTLLTGFELRDPILDITLDDVIVVFGDPTATIEPGQSFLLAYETVAERDIRSQTTVVGKPVAEDGALLPGREAAATVSIFIDAVDPGGIPSFQEGLEASWELLVRLGQALLLMLGSVIPFLWVAVGLWLLARWRRRHQPPTPPAPSPSVKEPVGVGAERDGDA